MSLRASQSELNLSNGFKKRLLRPVSTHKPNDLKISMKSSVVLSLRDHISIRNRFGEAKSILQTHCNLLTQNMEQSICKKKQSVSTFQSTLSSSKSLQNSQHFERIIKRITQKKEKREQCLKKSSQTCLNTQSKSIQAILKEMGAQNLQQGLRILYMQTEEAEQYFDECILLMCLCMQGVLGRAKSRDEGLRINEGDQRPVLMAKLLSFIVSCLQSTDNNTTQQKFTPILQVAQNNDKYTEISRVKLQLQRQKQANIILSQKLKALMDSQANTKAHIISDIQRVQRQIRNVYELALARKEEVVIKLKTEIWQYQQKLIKQSGNIDSSKARNLMITHDDDDKEMGYASTIQEEFQKMRTGFSKKLQKAYSQSSEKQLKLKRQIFNFEKQIQDCQREKTILFKKYEFLINNNT